MGEFNEMVTDYVQEEERKANNMFQRVTPFQKKKQHETQKPIKNKQRMKKNRQIRFKEEEMLFSRAMAEPKPAPKRFEIKTENKSRHQDRQVLSLGHYRQQ